MTGMKMMNSITADNFISFRDFDLNWRFTDPKHNLLPEEDLSEIHPLSKTMSIQLYEQTEKYLGNATLEKSKFQTIESHEITEDHEEVRKWLKEKIIDPQTQVAVSWDKTTCAVTTWRIFCEYWDDFCYPSSDDILIWASSEDWILNYCHHEILEFGVLKS